MEKKKKYKVFDDGVRSIPTKRLRKQFLNTKGKLFIYAKYINPESDKTAIILSNCASRQLGRKIDIKRATYDAIATGSILAMVERRLGSGVKLLKILDWGVLYGNGDVKIKRYSVKGKYRTGIWIKGQKGMYQSYDYKITKKDEFKTIADDLELTHKGTFSNEY